MVKIERRTLKREGRVHFHFENGKTGLLSEHVEKVSSEVREVVFCPWTTFFSKASL